MYQAFLESKRLSCLSNITICQSAGKRVRGECRRHVVELSHFESSMPSQMILKATPHYNVRSSNATAVHFNTLINSMRNSDALMNLHVLHRSDLAGQLICEYFWIRRSNPLLVGTGHERQVRCCYIVHVKENRTLNPPESWLPQQQPETWRSLEAMDPSSLVDKDRTRRHCSDCTSWIRA